MNRTVHKSTASTQLALITVTSCTAMDCTVVWYRKPIVPLYRGTECHVPLYRGTESQLYQNCSVLENALYRGPVRGKVLDIPSFIISYKLILPYFLLFIISSLIIWRGFLVNVIFNMCMSQTPKYAIGIGCVDVIFFALLTPRTRSLHPAIDLFEFENWN